MKDLIYFFNTKSNNFADQNEKLRFFVALLFVFSLPFDIFYSSIILIVFILLTFLDLKKDKFKNIPKQFWIFQLPFYLAIIGYFYSYNKAEASSMIERQLSIFIFPIILPLAIEINSQRKKWMLLSLTLSCVLAVCYLFFNVFSFISDSQLPLSALFSNHFFHHDFAKPLSIHAGYLSLFVSLSIVFSVQHVLVNKIIYKKLLYLCFTLILFSGLIFLASRNVIPTTFFILFFLVPFYYIKRKLIFILSSIALLSVLFISLSKISYLEERFSSNLVNDIVLSDSTNYSLENVEPRIERWYGAVDLIKQSPIIGYGTGDEIFVLKGMYFEKKYFISYLENFNIHNQYLSYLIKNGLIGFVLFLFAFLYYLRLAIKQKDFIYLSFLALLLVGFLTENILDANKGILFFAFLNTFFGYSILIKNKKEISS